LDNATFTPSLPALCLFLRKAFAMKDTFRVSVALLLTSLSISSARATDLYFGDLEKVSPNGRYWLTARSPDNAGPARSKPFQSDFVYVMRDTVAKRVLWTKKQPGRRASGLSDEGSPVNLLVLDDGWAILWLRGYELIAVSPRGEETAKISILYDAFSEEERKAHIDWTTAGPMWDSSYHYCASYRGSPYFVVCTAWRHRVIFDMARGQLVVDAGPIKEVLNRVEHGFDRPYPETHDPTRRAPARPFDPRNPRQADRTSLPPLLPR